MPPNAPGRVRRDALASRLAPIALLIGLIVHIGWGLMRKKPFATGEAANVAIALAHGRGFADAFAVGQGPTAHLLPTSPVVAGAVYTLLGVRTPSSEAVLIAWALLLVFGTFTLFAIAMRRIGAAPRAVLAGFVMICVIPVYTTIQSFDFRVWDGALGLALGALLLRALLRAEDGAPPRGFAWQMAILPAAAFFVSPPVGLAAVAAVGLFLWRRRADLMQWVRAGLGMAAALAVLVVPWTLRNMRELGHPIFLRDNLGMELAVANHPAALADGDRRDILYARLADIQPYIHPPAYAKLQQAGGEVPYAKLLGRQAVRWMRDNPRDVARLWVQHAREMLFTQRWMFRTANAGLLAPARSIFITIVALLGLAGLVWAAARRDGRYSYLALYVAVPFLCYLPFQPVTRYSWLIYPPLLFLAVDTIDRLIRRFRPAGG